MTRWLVPSLAVLALAAACGPDNPAAGQPCAAGSECLVDGVNNECRPEASFTCQPNCGDSPRRPCRAAGPLCCDHDPTLACLLPADCGAPYEYEVVDTCAREGPLACPAGLVCVLTGVGVRRCVHPCVTSERCNCLPDPEDPAGSVCWPGGTIRLGDACFRHHDCARGRCLDGRCQYSCGADYDGPCPQAHTCVDGVCLPDAP